MAKRRKRLTRAQSKLDVVLTVEHQDCTRALDCDEHTPGELETIGKVFLRAAKNLRAGKVGDVHADYFDASEGAIANVGIYPHDHDFDKIGFFTASKIPYKDE